MLILIPLVRGADKIVGEEDELAMVTGGLCFGGSRHNRP